MSDSLSEINLAGSIELSAEQQATLFDLARAAIRSALSQQPAPPIETSDPNLLQPAGCFVSLHTLGSHALRGCIGRTEASDALIHTLRDMAANVLRDPRFTQAPVTLDELPRLQIEISILSPLRPAAGPLDFEPMSDGIVLTIFGRSGLFLPQVARETGWTREELLGRLCVEKLGLAAIMWKHPTAQLQTFSTSVLGPVPLVQI